MIGWISGGMAVVRESMLLYRAVVFLALMGFAVLYMAMWGLKQAREPNDAQLVRVRTGLSPFSGWRAHDDLKELVGLGPRVAGTAGGEEARAIIRRELEEAGLRVEERDFEGVTPLGTLHMVNVVGVVEGSKEGILIFGTHYDTKYLPDIDFVGANDGGSTTAWMLEFARVLGRQRRGYTLWLCFFDGEEAFEEWSETDGLYGSRALVKELKEEGRLPEVKAMVNVDMIGDCYLGIYRDEGAPEWLERAVWDTAKSLGYATHFSSFPKAIEDDHVPFRRGGVPALNLIDFRYGGSIVEHDRNWHTARDTVDRVCAESLQAVGDVLYHALMPIEKALEERDNG